MDSKINIGQSTLQGKIWCPPSKSVFQRAVAAALLHKGTSTIENMGKSADEQAAIAIVKSLGAQVSNINDTSIQINSEHALQNPANIHCGESGLSLRMFSTIAALSSSIIHIDAASALKNRPINGLKEIYDQLGIACDTSLQLPFQVQGPIHFKNLKIDGSLSSQYLTGLLMTLSHASREGLLSNTVQVEVSDLKSKPYIDLTLEVMEHFKMPLPKNAQYKSFTFEPLTNYQYPDKPIQFQIENDWSSAAFLLVAGTILGTIEVCGLNMFTNQADKAILLALQQAAVNMSISMESIKISKTQLQPFTFFDATDCPDLFPPLAALAACSNGMSAIRGVHRLIHKESNRSLALQQEFAKAGIKIIIQEDDMIIHGSNTTQAADYDSHNDHRIAMACAILAMNASGTSTISNAGAISKSYPDFFNDLKQLGAIIH